jgi:hypothetical protein
MDGLIASSARVPGTNERVSGGAALAPGTDDLDEQRTGRALRHQKQSAVSKLRSANAAPIAH